MELAEIKALVVEAKAAIKAYNELAEKLAEVGVTIELDTRHSPHGVVGVGRVDAKLIDASFMLELD